MRKRNLSQVQPSQHNNLETEFNHPASTVQVPAVNLVTKRILVHSESHQKHKHTLLTTCRGFVKQVPHMQSEIELV